MIFTFSYPACLLHIHVIFFLPRFQPTRLALYSMLLLPFSRCFVWPTFIDILVLVATSNATACFFLLALLYMKNSLMPSFFLSYVFWETQSTSLSRLCYDRVLPADRPGSHVLDLGSTFSSASRARIVDPVSFPVSAFFAVYSPPTFCLVWLLGVIFVSPSR